MMTIAIWFKYLRGRALQGAGCSGRAGTGWCGERSEAPGGRAPEQFSFPRKLNVTLELVLIAFGTREKVKVLRNYSPPLCFPD